MHFPHHVVSAMGRAAMAHLPGMVMTFVNKAAIRTKSSLDNAAASSVAALGISGVQFSSMTSNKVGDSTACVLGLSGGTTRLAAIAPGVTSVSTRMMTTSMMASQLLVNTVDAMMDATTALARTTSEELAMQMMQTSFQAMMLRHMTMVLGATAVMTVQMTVMLMHTLMMTVQMAVMGDLFLVMSNATFETLFA